MNKMHIFFNILLQLLTAFLVSTGVPLKRDDDNTKLTFTNERRFPNGTVIGTYTYKHKEGNPVHVKYYADDSSYGVELKSVKIFEPDSEQKYKEHEKLSNVDTMVTSSDAFGVDAINTVNSIMAKDYYKNNSFNPYEISNSYPSKKHKGRNKSNDEYEIFLKKYLLPSDK